MTFILEIIGTISFAFAGALIGIDNNLDIFGINCTAVLTATGGGMMRDIILGNTPPMLFRNPTFFSLAVISAFLTIIIYKPLNHSKYKQKLLFAINTLDAIGLAVFTVVGMQLARTLGFGDNGFLLCFMGVLTATGGGLLRDITISRTPTLLHKEVYATASIIGAVFYLYAYYIFDDSFATSITMLIIFVIRMWSIKKEINLPYVKKV